MNGAYCLTLANPNDLAARVQTIFDLVWRRDFSAPGFCLLDLGSGVDSRQLRAAMTQCKERFSECSRARDGVPLVYKSFVRSDQQETTKFHLDGAPPASLLMLGYEPSTVRSRLSLADYSRCACDRGLSPQQFLQEFNPMYRQSEDVLAAYVTELPQPEAGAARILFINNSCLPFTQERRNPLGVLHKAEMIDRSATAQRVVNSILLAAEAADDIDAEQVRHFMTTDTMSAKIY